LIRFQSGINPTNSRKIPANRKTRDAHHRTQARIREAIEEQSCFVVDRPVPVAYAMMDHRFFGRAFVWMIYVAASHRRRGIGTELLTALETRCVSDRIFTSTNVSNVPMQAL